MTATEGTKRAATDVRDSYGLFRITANADVANFYLAVKETGEAAPTAADMTDHGLKRKLSSTPINVLIAQRIDYYSQTSGQSKIFYKTTKLSALAAEGYDYQLVMLPFQSTFGEVVRNSYVLIDTSRITTNGNSSLHWEVSMHFSPTAVTTLYGLQFTIQE